MTIDRLTADRTSYLYGPNGAYIAELYDQYLADPGSVDDSWATLFADLRGDADAILEEVDGPGWGIEAKQARANVKASGKGAAKTNGALAPSVDAASVRAATLDSIRALMLIRAYRIRGHLYAELDPLGLHEIEYHPELDYKTYGFDEADLDRDIFIDNVLGMESATLRTIMDLSLIHI